MANASEPVRTRNKALLALSIALVALLVAAIVWTLFRVPIGTADGTSGAPVVPVPDSAGRSQPPDSPDALVCYQFRNRKNAGDPAAADLLGPAPSLPTAPVSPQEADRLQTEFFLRQNLRVVGLGWDAERRKVVLFTSGNVSAPTLHVQTAEGVEPAQRIMSNPDLTVEVRNGRIYGVSASLHLGP